MLFYVRIGVAAVILLVLSLLWMRARRWLRRWGRRRRRLRDCPSLVAAQGTILVVLRHRRAAAAAAATLRDLWDKAACPDRVHVAVYQEVRAGDPDIYALLGPGHPLRVLTAEAGSEPAPLGAALAEVVARARSHERTIVLVPTKAVFAEGWDRTRRPAAAARFGPRALLTGVPDRPPTVPRSPDMNGSLYRAIMRERGATLQAKAAGDAVPTIPVWTDTLRLAARPRGGERTGRPVPAVGACPEFACGGAALFAGLRSQRPGEGDDLWLSRALFAAGAQLRVADRVPVTAVGAGPSAGGGGQATPRDADFDAYAGLRSEGSGPAEVSGRALLGVTSLDDGHDVAAKFGSHSEFERLRAAFGLTPAPRG